MLTSDRLIQRKSTTGPAHAQGIAAGASFHIVENRQDASPDSLIKWLPQPVDIAEHSYETEMKTLSRDGTDDGRRARMRSSNGSAIRNARSTKSEIFPSREKH